MGKIGFLKIRVFNRVIVRLNMVLKKFYGIGYFNRCRINKKRLNDRIFEEFYRIGFFKDSKNHYTIHFFKKIHLNLSHKIQFLISL